MLQSKQLLTVAVALAVVLSAGTAVAFTSTTADVSGDAPAVLSGNETTTADHEDNETANETEDDDAKEVEAAQNATVFGESFQVTSINVSQAVQPGELLTVQATIMNPNDVATGQFVELRFGGVVVQAGELTLAPGESVTLELAVPTEGLQQGFYVVAVLTPQDGQATVVGIGVGAPPGNVTNVTQPDNVTNVTEPMENVTEPEPTENATVTFENQTSNDTTVVVESVTVPQGGYVAIHDSSLFEGAVLESVVGVSDYLEPGTHENVRVELFENATLEGNETLIAMPHRDTDGDGVYEFVTSNGTQDGPYVVNGSAVIDVATVEFVDEENVTNVTEPEDNVTNVTNVTDDLPDENVTENVTNVTENVTNVTENVTNVTENVTNVTEPMDNVTNVTENVTAANASFRVVEFQAPEVAEIGETVTVTATIENPNDEAVTQPVEFRVGGNLVERETLALGADETRNVTFTLETAGLPPGEYVHSVLTRQFGQVAVLELTEAAANVTDENVTNVTEPEENVTVENETGDGETNVTIGGENETEEVVVVGNETNATEANETEGA